MRPAEVACMAEVAFAAPPHSVMSSSGADPARLARNVTCVLMRDLLGMSNSEIGTAIGRDPSTVSSNCRAVEKLAAKDDEFDRRVQLLHRAIEFRLIAASRLETDPLEIAQRIVLNPRRASMQSSLYEIASVAAMLTDLWQAALAAEAALNAVTITETGVAEMSPETLSAVAAVRGAFLNHMDAFRTTNGDEDNG